MPLATTLRPILIAGLMLGAAGCVRQPVDAPPKSVVFFTNDSVGIDGPAQRSIDEFAKDAMSAPTRRVLVEGYADPSSSPSPASNRQLSLARAQVVADALVARGVDRSRITLRPRSPGNTDPGVESRRVELEFNP